MAYIIDNDMSTMTKNDQVRLCWWVWVRRWRHSRSSTPPRAKSIFAESSATPTAINMPWDSLLPVGNFVEKSRLVDFLKPNAEHALILISSELENLFTLMVLIS